MRVMEKKKGVIVVAHGSKSAEACAEFNHVVDEMRKYFSNEILVGAHLDINEPDIPGAIDLLLAEKIIEITVIPYFLFKGNHTKIDIPKILRAKKKLHPQLRINYSHPVGTHPLMADILFQRANEPNLTII